MTIYRDYFEEDDGDPFEIEEDTEDDDDELAELDFTESDRRWSKVADPDE